MIEVLYRDEAVAAIAKPAGIPSEPTRDPLRANALSLARARLGLSEGAHLGLPHRLDRDTSGVLLLSLTPAALAALGEALRDRTAEKLYLARVHGLVAWDSRTLESFLAPTGKRGGKQLWGEVRSGGKKAITEVRVLTRVEATGTTLVECRLLTGRTHQARVHLASAGHPLVGDEDYGAPRGEHARVGRHLLHAWRVTVPHPAREGNLEVVCPPPRELDPGG